MTNSAVEAEILEALRAHNGTYTNAFRLIVCDLGRAWANGHRCLGRLEQQGRIQVERRTPPRPVVIRLVNHDL